jgi:PilZ domain
VRQLRPPGLSATALARLALSCLPTSWPAAITPKVLLHLCRYSGIPERYTIFPAGQQASSQRKLQLRAQDQPAARTIQEIVDARRSPRLGLDIKITIHSRTSGMLTGRSVDISESGISATLTMEVPVDEIVELEFALPAGPVNICATVRQKVAFRYGFQFLGQSAVNDVIWATCRQRAIEASQ